MIRDAMWCLTYSIMLIATLRALAMAALLYAPSWNMLWPVAAALAVYVIVSIIDRITWK